MIEFLNGLHETVDYRGDFKIRLYMNRECEDYPRHWHTDAEVIMPVDNSYRIVIDDNTYDLDADDIIFIPPGELHQIHSPSSGYRIILQFDCTLLYSLKGFSSAFDMFHPCVLITPSSMPNIHSELVSLVMGMASEYYSSQPFKEALVYSMLIRFFSILGRNCIRTEGKFSNIKNHKQLEYIKLFVKVCNYINRHCTENIKVEEIANIAGFSKYHFARLFKQVMNMSWYDYLINRRIMQAEKLLADQDLSIMQVAMKSGFSSLATFNRVFRSRKGCTPSQYKAQHGRPAK
ncbi:MAG: AraC family transcriptional regulator [Clostridiaceae bacterium]|nr:AraC family transcriptional regulator [Clostridiaceae bacterium]